MSWPAHLMARSRAMMVATTASIFSVDFCLSGLMFPAGVVRMWMLSTIQASTLLPPVVQAAFEGEFHELLAC